MCEELLWAAVLTNRTSRVLFFIFSDATFVESKEKMALAYNYIDSPGHSGVQKEHRQLH